MRKLLLFLFSITNVNFSLLIISCDIETFDSAEKVELLNQVDDEKIMQQFINKVKKIDLKLSKHVLPSKIQIIVLNKLNAVIKKDEKYKNIRVKIENINEISEDNYTVSYFSLIQGKKHIKFASTLTVRVRFVNQSVESETDAGEEDQLQMQPLIGNVKDEETKDVKEIIITSEENSTSKEFSLDYQEKFRILQQEIRLKTFEYDFAQTTYNDFITTILTPWFEERLIDLNYKFDLTSNLLEEIMGNTISNFILDISFNDEEKTKQQLLIKVNCKEKATVQAHNILETVWTSLELLQRQNFQFKDLPSQPTYSDIIERFEEKLKSENSDYQNFAFIFKGIKETKDKNNLLQKGNNKICFTLAVDNKSFFYLFINYVF